MAPFDVHLVGLGKGSAARARGRRVLYEELRESGLAIVYDDRDVGPGEKFADAELLGVPLRLTVGWRTRQSARSRPRSAGAGRPAPSPWRVPPTRRWSCGQPPVNDDAPRRPPDGARVARTRSRKAQEMAEKARLTFRAASPGWISGPPPPRRCQGQPLNPWTIPNAIGFIRLALIPVFLASPSAPATASAARPVIIFAVVAWSDYLDGIAARVTGQYSRFGALLDPAVDRLLVISGVAVAGTSSCCRAGRCGPRRARAVC